MDVSPRNRVLETCLNLQDVHIYGVCVCDKPFSDWQRLCSAELQYKAHLPQNMTTNMTPQRYMILNPPSIHDNRSHHGSTTPFCRYLEGRAEDCTIQSTWPPTHPAGRGAQNSWIENFNLQEVGRSSPSGAPGPQHGCSKLTGTGIPPRFICAYFDITRGYIPRIRDPGLHLRRQESLNPTSFRFIGA